MKQKHRKLAGSMIAVFMLLLSATGSSFASEGEAQNAALIVEVSEIIQPAELDDTTSADEARKIFRDILGDVDVNPAASAALYDLFHPESDPVKEQAAQLSSSQVSAAETLLRNLNTSKDKSQAGQASAWEQGAD